MFLIESKALNVLIRGNDISMEKRVNGIQKQIKKGVDQLIGAAKKIAENIPIYDSAGQEISFDRTLFSHCIVLVSELYAFGEWDHVVLRIFQAMIEQPMCLNVMDLQEFMHIIGASQGKRDRFDYFLLQRRDDLIKNMNIHSKMQIVLVKD